MVQRDDRGDQLYRTPLLLAPDVLHDADDAVVLDRDQVVDFQHGEKQRVHAVRIQGDVGHHGDHLIVLPRTLVDDNGLADDFLHLGDEFLEWHFVAVDGPGRRLRKRRPGKRHRNGQDKNTRFRFHRELPAVALLGVLN